MNKYLFTFFFCCICGATTPSQAYSKVKSSPVQEKKTDKWTDTDLDSLYQHNPFFLKEIVIQGFKQDKEFKLSPVAASSFSSNLLQRERVTSIKEITGLVPNFFMPDYGAKISSPVYIRGIGSKINSPSIGLYIDGVPYFESASFDFNFSGIESIDVLRGPQGTLYGRNTMGGIINVYTKSPLHHQGSSVSFRGGSYNQYDLSAAHYLRIKEGMGLALSANYNHFGGVFKNQYLNEKADELDAGAGRIRFDWEINPQWSLKLISSLDYLDQNGYPFGKYDPATNHTADVNYNSPTTYRRLMSSSGANVEYQGDGFKLSNQLSFQYVTDAQKIDQDFTEQDIYAVQKKEIQRMFSEELNIKSSNDSKYQWLFGLFGFHQSIHRDLNMDLKQKGTLDYKRYELPTYGFAVFHQSTLNDLIWQGLSLSAGVRFDYEHTDLDYLHQVTAQANTQLMNDSKQSLNFRQLTPKFTLQYTSPNEQNIYTSVTRGFKAGGFNTSFDTKSDKTFDPEYSWNYELGVKLNFFDHRLTADLALFYIDWKDQQLHQPLLSGQGRKLKNIGKSASKGVEASITAHPVDALTLQANYGYTKAYFKKYDVKEGLSLKDKRLPLVPDHTLALHADYTFYVPRFFFDEIQLGLSYLGTGKIYWADNNLNHQSYYDLLNAQLTVRTKQIDVSVWAKNILNKKYQAYVVATGPNHFAQKGKPFTIGASISLNL